MRMPSSTPLRMSCSAILMTLAACAAPPVNEPKIVAPVAVEVARPEPAVRIGPPLAPLHPVTDSYFGQTVTDPYRYMEGEGNAESRTYMRSQGEFARRTLDSIPGREAMQNRISSLAAGGVQINAVQVIGTGSATRVFYFRQGPDDPLRKLYVREGFKGSERLLLDPKSISSSGKQMALNSFLASPDGRHILVGITASGSEASFLRLIEVASGRDQNLLLDRIGFAESSAWTPDGKAFFYNRLPENQDSEAASRYLNSRIYRHVLGRPADKDEVLLGATDGAPALAAIDIPSVEMSADGKHLVGRVQHGDLRELTLYVAAASDLPNAPKWRKAVDVADQVIDHSIQGGALYLITHKNAPRNKVVRTSLDRPDFANATTIIPHGDTVIKQIEVAQDALYIRELSNGVDRLQRLNFSNSVYSGGKLEFVRLPFDLGIRQLITDPKRPGALLRLEGWTEAPKYVTIEERTANVSDTGLHPKPAVDFSGVDEVRLTATAKDGSKIPVTLIYKKGTTLNRINPTILTAFGAYGAVPAPTFAPTTMAWIERGGIIGICHVRGGGEYGDDWYQGGQKLNKRNSWQDLIACGEYLVQRGFTRPERLAIQGGRAGGIAVGRAMSERPDLFAAVVPNVALLDTLRVEFGADGTPMVPEFGSVNTAEGFKGLLAMSPLNNIQDGVRYPSVLLIHGIHERRVAAWQSAKMAARLQAATAEVRDANPVLLRLDEAGDGAAATRQQRNEELADVYSFLLWRFGFPEFQPK